MKDGATDVVIKRPGCHISQRKPGDLFKHVIVRMKYDRRLDIRLGLMCVVLNVNYLYVRCYCSTAQWRTVNCDSKLQATNVTHCIPRLLQQNDVTFSDYFEFDNLHPISYDLTAVNNSNTNLLVFYQLKSLSTLFSTCYVGVPASF